MCYGDEPVTHWNLKEERIEKEGKNAILHLTTFVQHCAVHGLFFRVKAGRVGK